MSRLAHVLAVGRRHLKSIGADADADAEVEGIFAQQQELRRRRMRKLLFKGASKGNEQDVQKAIDSGVSVNRVDGDEDPPLILAARIGSIGVLRQLLDAGAIIDARSSTQLETALYCAIFHGHEEAALFLLSAGANPNLAAANRDFPITLASRMNRLHVVRALIQYRARVDSHDTDNNTALIYAAMRGSLPVAQALIDAGAADAAGEDDRTALMFAVLETSKDHLGLVKALLRAGAPLDTRDDAGETALMLAAEVGNVRAVKRLLKAGADRTLLNKESKSALILAREQGHDRVVALLEA